MKILFQFYLLCLSDACYAPKTSTSVLTNKRENVSYRSYVFGLKNLKTTSKIFMRNLCELPRRCLQEKRKAADINCKRVKICEERVLDNEKYKNIWKIKREKTYSQYKAEKEMLEKYFTCVSKIYSC